MSNVFLVYIGYTNETSISIYENILAYTHVFLLEKTEFILLDLFKDADLMSFSLDKILTPPVAMGALTAVWFACMAQINANNPPNVVESPPEPSYSHCQP